MSIAEPPAASPCVIELVDGSTRDISICTPEELLRLQCEQEPAYARRILESAPGSAERAQLFAQAYDAITTILARRQASGGALSMGFDQRYVRLMRGLIERGQRRHGRRVRVFELGYGSGLMLSAAAQAGAEVAGIEVSEAMRRQALAQTPPTFHQNLHLGDFLAWDAVPHGQYDIIYWNDVLEHLHPDEAPAFLRKIRSMLSPGGCLTTITPNWHQRPSDVTAAFAKPRTEAVGFHLKEYTLGEVAALLKSAGFARVATPLYLTKRRIVLCGDGLLGLKQRCEGLLEHLPYRAARFLCRGLGLSITLAYA